MPRSIIDSGQINIEVVDPIANDDYSAGFDYGSEWVNVATSPKRFWKCMDPTIGAAVWQRMTTPYDLFEIKDNYANPTQFVAATMNNYALFQAVVSAGKAGNDCNVSMHNAKDRTDYFRCNSSTYQVFATQIYRGTTVWMPNLVVAAVSGTNASTQGRIRVWDRDNSALVVEMDAWTGTSNQLISKAISAVNLPVGQAWFEFQIKHSPSEARVHAIGLYRS